MEQELLLQKDEQISVGDCLVTITEDFKGKRINLRRIKEIEEIGGIYDLFCVGKDWSLYAQNTHGCFDRPWVKIPGSMYEEIISMNDKTISEICNYVRKNATEIQRIQKGDILIERDEQDCWASMVYDIDQDGNVLNKRAGASRYGYIPYTFEKEVDLASLDVDPADCFKSYMCITKEIAEEANQRYAGFIAEVRMLVASYIQSNN